MKKLFISLLGTSLLAILTACENNVEDNEVIACNPTISFRQKIKPIIDNNCLECHNGNRFPDLRTYNSIKMNAGNIKIQTQTRQMPRSGSLTTAQIEAIACWIDSGAQNN